MYIPILALWMCAFHTDRYYDDGCWLDDAHDTDLRPHLCGRRERAMNRYDARIEQRWQLTSFRHENYYPGANKGLRLHT